ncbi:MAG: uL22 family ribosomal protein [Patescibacteria group bacterium]
MAVTVKLKFVRHSARKLTPVARIFRGKNLERAIEETSLMPQQSAYYINKALKMAKAAATAKEFKAEDLVVTSVSSVTGPKIKRVRPNARGRTNAYLKHLAHIIVTVDNTPPAKSKRAKSDKKDKE